MFQRVAPKPSRPGKPVLRKAPLEIVEHLYLPAQVRVPGQGWKMLDAETANRIARKSTGGVTAAVTARRERELFRAIDKGFRDAERAVLAELREAERSNRALWHRCHTFLRREVQPRPKQHRATKTGWVRAAKALPTFSGPIIDRMGRRGMFLRVRYYGNKTTKRGVATVAVAYIWNGAVEVDGELRCISNVGETFAETLAAFDHLEQINRAGQANAKVAFHMIANLPFELSLDRMMEIGSRFCEQAFGDHDLPYVVALHAPAPESDQRNWHLHMIFSFRPMVRVGDHQWDIGDQLHTELDNTDGFRRMRELYAEIQTEVSQEAGLDRTYTALSNDARGLPTQPGIHYGPARTAIARRGEPVAAVEINEARIIAGTAAMIDEKLRHIAESAARDLEASARILGRYATRIGTSFVERIRETRALLATRPLAAPIVAAPTALRLELTTVSGAAVSTISNLKMPSLSIASTMGRLPARSDLDVAAVSFQWHSPTAPLLRPAPFPARLETATPNLGRRVTLGTGPIAARPVLNATVLPASSAVRSAVVAGQLEPILPAALPLMRQAPLGPAATSGRLLPSETARPLSIMPSPMTSGSRARLSRALPGQTLIAWSVPPMPPRSEEGLVMSAQPVVGKPVIARAPALSSRLPTTTAISTAATTWSDLDQLLEHVRLKAERSEREKRERARLAASTQVPDIEAVVVPAVVRLRERDDWVEETDTGFAISAAALSSIGRSRTWMLSPDGQARLANLAADQERRMDAIIDASVREREPIRFDKGRPRLSAGFDADQRRAFARWSEDFAFILHAATIFWQLRAMPVPVEAVATDASAGEGWRRAALLRRAAMAKWDSVRPFEPPVDRSTDALPRNARPSPAEVPERQAVQPRPVNHIRLRDDRDRSG